MEPQAHRFSLRLALGHPLSAASLFQLGTWKAHPQWGHDVELSPAIVRCGGSELGR